MRNTHTYKFFVKTGWYKNAKISELSWRVLCILSKTKVIKNAKTSITLSLWEVTGLSFGRASLSQVRTFLLSLGLDVGHWAICVTTHLMSTPKFVRRLSTVRESSVSSTWRTGSDLKYPCLSLFETCSEVTS